jgi:hypothetical protein
MSEVTETGAEALTNFKSLIPVAADSQEPSLFDTSRYQEQDQKQGLLAAVNPEDYISNDWVLNQGPTCYVCNQECILTGSCHPNDPRKPAVLRIDSNAPHFQSNCVLVCTACFNAHRDKTSTADEHRNKVWKTSIEQRLESVEKLFQATSSYTPESSTPQSPSKKRKQDTSSRYCTVS